MQKPDVMRQRAELQEIFNLSGPGVWKKIFKRYKLRFVTFELVNADGSQSFRIEMTYPRANFFLRSLKRQGFCD